MGITSVMSTIGAYLADALAGLGLDDEALRYSLLSEQHAAKGDVATQVIWRVVRAKVEKDDSLGREAVRLAETTDHPDLKARALAGHGEIEAARHIYEAKGNVAAAARLATPVLPS
jgi:hypothetical protein